MGGTRRRVMGEAWVYTRRAAPRLLLLAAVLTLVGAAAHRWLAPTRPWLAGLVVGILATGYLWVTVWVLWVSSGVHQRMQSAYAHERTATTLHRLRMRSGWHVVPDVAVAGEVADLVLVSPAGVVSIETKWSVQPWVADDVSRASERAATAAAGVERLVHQVDARVPVRAAIVVWGPAAPGLGRRQVPMGRHLVDVVPAGELRAWARGLRHGDVTADVAELLSATLTDRRVTGQLPATH